MPGFVIEISAATIVFIGSRFGLPISTTHCLVGAVAGIGERVSPGHALSSHVCVVVG